MLNPTPGRLDNLTARISKLHDQEREALDELGNAYLRGHSGAKARERLEQIRRELEQLHAAQRILHRSQASP